MGMPPLPTLALFAAATLALLLIPGPSVLFIVARTLEHGRRGGLVSMLGVEAGALAHGSPGPGARAPPSPRRLTHCSSCGSPAGGTCSCWALGPCGAAPWRARPPAAGGCF